MSEQPHLLHRRRRAGILLHPTSLPGPFPHGIICHDAYRFIEFLARSGITVWQMLPLGPTHSDRSPYQSLSAHACDTSLISLDWLADRKLIDPPQDAVNEQAHAKCLEQAWARFVDKPEPGLRTEYHEYQRQHAYWLNDYALFMALREHYRGVLWTRWPAAIRDREPAALEKARNELAEQIDFHRFCQFIFFTQWKGLREYAQQNGVLLFGDLPIYVAHDSADVWAHRHLFLLDKDGAPSIVAGVPPDYFSETGQLWGNPQYDWAALEAEDFHWWQQRLATQLGLFDLVRVDHFRGFQAYWEIAADQKTAIDGRWVKAPGEALLASLQNRFTSLPLVAEDLGVITEQVTALRRQFNLPGMKILQFAFDGNPKNTYLPHHHEFNSVTYTGTHDNDTTLSWYEALEPQQRGNVNEYACVSERSPMPWPLVELALGSVSCLAVLPMQDILALGKGHRMNTPGTTTGNWDWRFTWEHVPAGLEEKLAALCRRYNRLD